MVLAVAFLMRPAQAQTLTYIWGGTGATTATTDYNLGTNWENPPAGAPPIAFGQAATFDTSGLTTVNVSAGPIAPNFLFFTGSSQSYTLSGSNINFGVAGFSGGVMDFAAFGQTISISNNLGESVAGVQVLLQGSSTLVLSGTNTYSGGTIVAGFGTLQATNNSAVGTGAVTLDDGQFQAGAPNLTFGNNFRIQSTAGGSAIDANGYALTISGNITDLGGAGELTIVDSAGGGVVILTGNNTYSGGTTICGCGTLQLGDATHAASIVGAVTNDGQFNIFNANTSGITSITTDGGLTYFLNNTTAGTATLVNKNVGVLLFLDNSSAGSANITNRGGSATVFGLPGGTDSSTAGNATIDNKQGSVVVFQAMSNAGAAAVTNGSSGQVVFLDQASAASATIVNNNLGFTQFGNSSGTDTSTAGNANIINNSGGQTYFSAFSTAGNATITANSGGSVQFFDNSTGGNAQFITNGTGYVDFGESLGPNGDGRITAGSIAGSGFYYIGGGNTLIVGGNNLSTTVSGVIADNNPCGCTTGPGSLQKVGAGMLTLSGTNSYTGTTTVNGGFLDVEGSIVSSSLTTVNAGGALVGAGSVGNTTIAAGGIFLPGNGSPGSSMTVAGNLAFQSGALYLVLLNSTTSTSANVTGAAILAGTVGAAILPGSTVLEKYTILTAAGGVSGTFAGLVFAGNSGGLVASLSYDPTHAYLDFTPDFGSMPGLSTNQRNVGNALSNFFSANGGIPAVFAALTPAGLAQASGETATGSQTATFNAMNLFLNLLSDPSIDGRGNGFAPSGGAQPYAAEDDASLAYAAKKATARDAFAKIPTKAEVARNDLLDSRWSVWGTAFGGGANIDGNAAQGSSSATARAFGLVAGADYRISPATLAGFALGGGGTNFSVTNFGSGRSDLFQAGAFVRHTRGNAYVSAAAAYGWQDVTTDRTVTIAGLDRLHAEFNANAYSGRVEGGYRFVTRWMGITPYAAGQFTTFSLPAYAEQVLAGTGNFALNYAARDATDARSELGLRTDKSFATRDGILTLRGRFAWAHDFDTDRTVTAVFQTLPGAAFVVGGAAQAHDSALTTASIEMKWLNGWSAAGTFEGEFSDVSSSYAGKGVVRYAW